MSEKSQGIAGIQPAVLRWARELSGKTLENVAVAMKKKVAIIEAWERGEATPTYVQLEKLAYEIYKRPLAIFFLPEPPKEADLKRSFRTLPQTELDSLLPDTLFALRHARALQMSLEELNEGVNPSQHLIFRDVKLDARTDFRNAAERIRTYMGVTLETQTGWRSIEEALDAWRNRVENAGVFVFKRAFKQADISAFCIYDKQFPIIYINNGTAKARQIFSLIHELGHILLHMNCLAKIDESYITHLIAADRTIEESCNQLASECLVPSRDFDQRLKNFHADDASLSKLADRYWVSREVIMRRLLDKRIIDRAFYNRKVGEWQEQGEKKKKSSGGDYYRTQATYLGNGYLSLVFGKYYQGKLSIDQVADYLGVKTSSVPGIENVFGGKQASE